MLPRIISVVEGQGEIEAVPLLIRRIAYEYCVPPIPVETPTAIRISRSKVIKPGELERAVTLGTYQLAGAGAVLVVLDADDDCPAVVGPQLLARAQAIAAPRGNVPVSIVIAKAEFEAWFLAAAVSLRGIRGLAADLTPPAEPESKRDAKGWLSAHKHGNARYSEVLDQPALAATMDLTAARQADSFDKFCRDLIAILHGLPHAEALPQEVAE
jgi:hypothetical protein